MTTNYREIGLEKARSKIGPLARAAHYAGTITYLTEHRKRIAAIVPVGSAASAIPKSAIDAGMEAAWSELPKCMTLDEARRRTIAIINAVHPYLAELVDDAERRGERRGDRDSYQ